MSKAIVIKGADFTANKLATITFDGVHTESVSVSPASIAATEIGATYSISASLVPNYSVDPVIWVTSDSNVATVSDGQVTIVGCGICTISAISGGKSATCTITVVVPLTTGFDRSVCTVIYAANDVNDLTTVNSYKDTKAWRGGQMAIYAEDSSRQKLPLPYNYVNTSVTPYQYQSLSYINDNQPANHGVLWPTPIELPPNCTKIRFKQLSDDYGVYPLFFQKDVGSMYELTPKRKQAVPITQYTFAYETVTIVDVPLGYDSFTATWQYTAGQDSNAFANMSESDLAKFTVEFM